MQERTKAKHTRVQVSWQVVHSARLSAHETPSSLALAGVRDGPCACVSRGRPLQLATRRVAARCRLCALHHRARACSTNHGEMSTASADGWHPAGTACATLSAVPLACCAGPRAATTCLVPCPPSALERGANSSNTAAKATGTAAMLAKMEDLMDLSVRRGRRLRRRPRRRG